MIWGRIIDVFRRRRLDADLDAQLAYHLDGLESEACARKAWARGRGPRRSSPRDGWTDQVQDAYREQLAVPVIEAL